MKEKNVWLAYLAVCFFWGSTYLAIKIGIGFFEPFSFAGTRFILAGGLMLSYGRIKGFAMPGRLREILPMALVGILLLTGGNGLVTLAEKQVDSGVASLFIAMVPIYITILEVWLLKRVKLNRSGYLGMFLGILGVYLLVGPSSMTMNWGVIMLLGAGLLWSIGSVYSKTITKSVHIVNSIGIQMISGGIVLWLIAIIRQESLSLDVPLKGYLALLYLIVFGSIVGYSAYIYLLKHWPASRAGTYAYVNPVVAVILGYGVLGESVSLIKIISMLTILVSVFIVQKSKMEVRDV